MKATRKTIPTLIQKRESFENGSGTMRGQKWPLRSEIQALLSRDTTSQLNEEEKTRLRIDFEQNVIQYIVLSYDTPIAWVTEDGWTYRVQQKFSQTTSKHQGLLYLLDVPPPPVSLP